MATSAVPKTDTPKRIVWTSDWSGRPMPTGFSRASYNCLKYLHDRGHEMVEVAVGYQGYGDETPWKTYPTSAYGGRLEGQDLAPVIAANCKADALVLFMDMPDVGWAIQYMDRTGRPLTDDNIEALEKRDFALCLYAPVDGSCPDGKPPTNWYKAFGQQRSFDAFAAPSKFGAELLVECSGREASVLPHGVDLSVFNPGDASPKEYRRRLGLPEDNFTLLYVGVNKTRKQLPAFYETVSKLQDRLPGVAVTAVVHGEDREDHYNLQGLVDIYGIEKKGGSVWGTKMLTDEGLSWLYRSADVLVHLTGSEGFGIPIIEAQACRVPAIVTNYSAMREIVPDAEREWSRIPVKALISQPVNNLAYAWPDTDVAAERLEAFYKDKGLRVRLRKAAFEHAKAYAWPNVTYRVEDWIMKAIAGMKPYSSRMRVEAVSV